MTSCDKRAYSSKGSARQAVQYMHETIRVYWCDECAGYHTTKERNGKASKNSRSWRAYEDRKRRAKMSKEQN